ncbi:MAG: flavodoxin domain-containing protein, partial [Coriobacteriaceae bacterium]|nr:flavodoxin domain-containing protein [Coriobacteriaceae bacterium]
MSNVAVVYWSGTGNTEAMAEEIAAGAERAGAHADLVQASDFEPSKVAQFDAFAFG